MNNDSTGGPLMIKKVLILLTALAIVFTSFDILPVGAAEAVKPDVPKFKVEVSGDESVFTFTISKTLNADGYRIYAKEPGSSKYRIVATIKKNGKKARTYTYSPFNPGNYTFKIKAYHKNRKSKVWSDTSAVKKITVKSDIFSRVPVGIRFAEGIRTDFKQDMEEPGGSDKNKYKLEYEVDEGLEDAEIRMFIVNSDGTRTTDRTPFTYDDVQASVGFFEQGECYAVLYAFGKSADVNLRNPLARSEKLKLRAVDENGNSVVKYADITFKNGYAYFGTAPTELVTDKALKAKIIATTADHGVFTYKGEKYIYDDKFDVGPFKYVPAEWRILEQTDDYVLLMNNCIIGGGGYDGWREAKTTTWKTSCLYYMLNRYNDYTKSERTFDPLLKIPADNVLIEMDICGVKTKVGIPTVELLTDKGYGFSTSKGADSNRVVTPSKHYDIITNHKATRGSLKLYGMYWVANEKAGETICVDQNGKILVGPFECNVYELGVVNVIKVDLTHCNVINE